MTRRRSIGLFLADDLGAVRTVTVEAEVSHQGWQVTATDSQGRRIGQVRLVPTQAMVTETVLDILRPLVASSFTTSTSWRRFDEPGADR